MPNRYMLIVSAAALLAAGACAEGDLESDTTTTDVQFDATAIDTTTTDTGTTADVGTPDNGAPDAGLPDVPPTDVAPTDVPVDVPPMDIQFDTSFPDLIPDNDPPTIVSTTPTKDETNVAVPFVVTVTFSEPVHEPTALTPITFKVTDVNGIELNGTHTLNADRTVLTFTPADGTFFRASPYSGWVGGGVLKDLAGNAFVGDYRWDFFTENFPNMSAYHDLAVKYSPVVHSGTDFIEGLSQLQVPTKFDSDGDWDGGNNKAWLQKDAESIIPALYYNVTETRSHFLIHYMMYFPWMNAASGIYEGGANGILVTVRKNGPDGAEAPISVTTYYKDRTNEEMLTYATTESGLVTSGQSAGFYNIENTYDQATLFPDGHFELLVTQGDHHVCAWVDEDNTIFCQLNSGIKAGMTKLSFKYTNGSPTPVLKAGGWPLTNDDVMGEPDWLGVALIPIQSTYWPRRTSYGAGGTYDNSFVYKADSGRVGDGSVLPASFIDSIDNTDTSFGRPLWAWRFDPSFGSTSNPGGQVRPGEIGVDPAWYMWKRHRSDSTPNTLTTYDPATRKGFSPTYCFNALANIDQRTQDPLCAPITTK